jgi:hypothetical protein
VATRGGGVELVRARVTPQQARLQPLLRRCCAGHLRLRQPLHVEAALPVLPHLRRSAAAGRCQQQQPARLSSQLATRHAPWLSAAVRAGRALPAPLCCRAAGKPAAGRMGLGRAAGEGGEGRGQWAPHGGSTADEGLACPPTCSCLLLLPPSRSHTPSLYTSQQDTATAQRSPACCRAATPANAQSRHLRGAAGGPHCRKVSGPPPPHTPCDPKAQHCAQHAPAQQPLLVGVHLSRGRRAAAGGHRAVRRAALQVVARLARPRLLPSLLLLLQRLRQRLRRLRRRGQLAEARPQHRERLAGAGLAKGEDGDAEAVQRGVDQLLHPAALEQLRLHGAGGLCGGAGGAGAGAATHAPAAAGRCACQVRAHCADLRGAAIEAGVKLVRLGGACAPAAGRAGQGPGRGPIRHPDLRARVRRGSCGRWEPPAACSGAWHAAAAGGAPARCCCRRWSPPPPRRHSRAGGWAAALPPPAACVQGGDASFCVIRRASMGGMPGSQGEPASFWRMHRPGCDWHRRPRPWRRQQRAAAGMRL